MGVKRDLVTVVCSPLNDIYVRWVTSGVSQESFYSV